MIAFFWSNPLGRKRHTVAAATQPEMGDEDFDVNGVTCRPLVGFIVKVGIDWPRKLRFTVKLHTGEDHEAAARRWLATERGQRHSVVSGFCDGGGAEEQTDRCDSAPEPTPLRLGCVACQDADCVAALYSTGGRFFCGACVDDPANEESVRQAAAEQLVAREAAAVQDFALGLASGQTHAVHASQAEWHIEGPYWLVKVSSVAQR
jgi:hypothetical protein